MKIRGFRIELGEIENRLLKHETINEAIVIAKEETSGHKYLAAYIVGERDLSATELREHLLKELPEFMIPSYFIQVEKIPLTPNGKIDRKALPEPSGDINTGEEYEAPRNEKEEILAKVWKEVLKTERIGIKDHFFSLGGDSIKALQVLSRLTNYRLKLEMKDLFLHPVIEELSNYLKSADHEIDQGMVEGEVGLTPIQTWLLEKDFEKKHHFNQAVMLYSKEGFDENLIGKVFLKLAEHHDALRIVVKKEGERIVQYNRGIEGEIYSLEVKDLVDNDNFPELIAQEADRIQGSIDLSKGPLVKAALFHTKEGDHLLVVIHHLVIDGISWRIIFEDFATGYLQALNNEEIKFKAKTDSFKGWSEKLSVYANSLELQSEVEYWRTLEELDIKPLPRDGRIEVRRNEDNENVPMELTREETDKLLKQVNRAYNTEINDILLTALGLAIKDWTGADRVLIDLEGHGREEIIKDIDISRTVGWFTIQYPVVMDMEGSKDLSYRVKSVKENIRHIPNKGIGYGILKYLTGAENKQTLRFNLQPEIRFNYLGQFDEDAETGVFIRSGISRGRSISPNIESNYAIDINGVITGGKLKLTLTFNRNEHARSTIEKLAGAYKENLVEIIDHCAGKESTELTPSDFSSRNLTFESVAEVIEGFLE